MANPRIRCSRESRVGSCAYLVEPFTLMFCVFVSAGIAAVKSPTSTLRRVRGLWFRGHAARLETAGGGRRAFGECMGTVYGARDLVSARESCVERSTSCLLARLPQRSSRSILKTASLASGSLELTAHADGSRDVAGVFSLASTGSKASDLAEKAVESGRKRGA